MSVKCKHYFDQRSHCIGQRVIVIGVIVARCFPKIVSVIIVGFPTSHFYCITVRALR